jgi:transposase InsO family protein
LRQEVKEEMAKAPQTRLTGVLKALDIAGSTWYRRPAAGPPRPPGPAPKPVPPEVVQWVLAMATANPWYGYKRIAVMCRRAGQRVKNRQAYQVMGQADLLHRPLCRKAELYQTAKLFELLPSGPNQLWQMDVTYIHIPAYGWWYAVTVIDYYSRYLLVAHLTSSYSAREVTKALAQARQEAERLCGPLAKQPFLVTDNGPSFVARRFGAFVKGQYGHVRIAYRTPTQLGLLERFHRTLKEEEVYWRIYDNPEHARACLAEFRQRYNHLRPHWALRPEAGGDPLVPHEVYALGRKVGIPKWQGWAKAAREKLDKLMAQEAAA